MMMAGVVPSRHKPPAPLFANQQWRYRDVVFVFAIITASEVVPLPRLPIPATMWLSAIVNGSIALVITASVWAVVRWKHRRPWQALGLDSATACYNTLWSLRIALGVVSMLTVSVLLIRLNLSDTHHAMAGPRGVVKS